MDRGADWDEKMSDRGQSVVVPAVLPRIVLDAMLQKAVIVASDQLSGQVGLGITEAIESYVGYVVGSHAHLPERPVYQIHIVRVRTPW